MEPAEEEDTAVCAICEGEQQSTLWIMCDQVSTMHYVLALKAGIRVVLWSRL